MASNNMLFTENKRKKTPNQEGAKRSSKKREQKKGEKALIEGMQSWATSVNSDGVVPAWTDSSVDKLMVNIEDSSRLRKLKAEEGETHVTGADYMKRLQ